MFFDGWASIGRVVLLATCAYALLVTALRVAGPQAVAKMSAYDLVITIALGSIVATIPLGTGVSVADGAAVVVTYLALQAVLRQTVEHAPRLRRIIKAEPRLVLWNGQLLEAPLRALDVTEEEVRAAIRQAGFGSLGHIQAVVLENDGSWSVVPRSQAHDLSACAGLPAPESAAGPA